MENYNVADNLKEFKIAVTEFLYTYSLYTLENIGYRGGTVVKVLRYKSEGRWFNSKWCHWNFSLT